MNQLMEGVAQHLNALSDAACRSALTRCCGSAQWVEGMMAHRPFADDQDVFEAAEAIWPRLERSDWLEALAQHPRIGERPAGDWERGEQSGVASATTDTRRALAEGNREYEHRFGHVFLICATNRSADEMLAELRQRLTHDAETEIRIAAEEQAKITRLRLRKLVTG